MTMILAVSVASLATAGGAVDPVGPAPSASSTWIVTLDRTLDAKDVAAGLARRAGGDVVTTYEHVLNGFAFNGSPAAAAALAQAPAQPPPPPRRFRLV